jgi:hypothetical protein
MHVAYVGLARTLYIHPVFVGFSANNTVYTPYISMVLANPTYMYVSCQPYTSDDIV